MKLKLVNIKDEAQDTKSFFFKPEKQIKYLPGQYFYITLPKLLFDDTRGATRQFSLSSSPTEGEIIRITTRIRDQSGFKQSLARLDIATEVIGEGPDGTFVLDENEKGSHIFVAGGIGITPFRSMIKYCIDKNLKFPLHLIYSNSKPDQIAFRSELDQWNKQSDIITVDMTITQTEGLKNWTGLTGRIDDYMIKKISSRYREPTYWISGPPAMVDAMEIVLGKLQVSSGKVRSEKFTGY